MIEQVAVAHGVHAAKGEETAHVLLHLLAVLEGVVQLVHQLTLFVAQAIGISRIYRGQESVAQGILLAVVAEHTPLEVNQMEQFAPLHLEFGPTGDNLGLQLELNHGDGLVHLGNQAEGLLIVLNLVDGHLGGKHLAGVIGVGLHGEGSQRQEVDAVAILQRGQVGIAHGHADDVGHAGIISGGRTHPEQVVVTPLDIKVMIVAEGIHDDVCTRSAVIDVAHDMERIDGEPLDEVAHGDDEVVGPSGGDDGTDNHVDVGMLVGVDARLMKQLLDDVREALGQRLAHL